MNAARDLKASHGLLVVADFDGDGHPDVLSGTHVVLSEEGLYDTGVDANGDDAADNVPEERTPKKYWQGPAPLAVTALDVDEDGDVDIVALTREGEFVVVLNDGSGTFDKLTQKRLPVRNSANTGADFALSGSFQMAEHDETKSPRMVPFNRGVAFAMETGLGYFSFTAVTDEHAAVAPIGAPLQSGQLVLDMKTARLNGQAGQYKDDLIFLTDDGQVHIVEHDRHGARGRGGRARRRRLGAAPRRGQRHGRRAARVQARRGRRQGRHAAGPGRQRGGRWGHRRGRPALARHRRGHHHGRARAAERNLRPDCAHEWHRQPQGRDVAARAHLRHAHAARGHRAAGQGHGARKSF